MGRVMKERPPDLDVLRLTFYAIQLNLRSAKLDNEVLFDRKGKMNSSGERKELRSITLSGFNPELESQRPHVLSVDPSSESLDVSM